MSKTNETPSRLEITKTTLIKALKEAIETVIDIDEIVRETRTSIERSRLGEKNVGERGIPYPDWMQWQGPVGLE